MGMKILVVDDSPTMRSLAESSLRQKGYEVMLADNVQKGLEIIKCNQLDLLLLDYSLPNIECAAMCRRLKNEEGSKNIPLVVLLTSAEMNKREELKVCGADGFIVKPFTAKELISKVEGLITRKNPKEVSSKQHTEPSEIPTEEKSSGSDEIELNAMLIDTSGKLKSTEKDKFEETSASLDLDSIKPLAGPFEENAVSADSLSDSSKIQVPSGSDLSHDYNWFVSEIKKEMQESKDEGKPEGEIVSEDSSIDFMSQISLEDERISSPGIQKPAGDEEFERFMSEFKREIEGVPVGGEGFEVGARKEEKPQEKTKESSSQKNVEHDKLANQIVEKLSERIAQKIVENLDRDFLRQIIEECLKES